MNSFITTDNEIKLELNKNISSNKNNITNNQNYSPRYGTTVDLNTNKIVDQFDKHTTRNKLITSDNKYRISRINVDSRHRDKNPINIINKYITTSSQIIFNQNSSIIKIIIPTNSGLVVDNYITINNLKAIKNEEYSTLQANRVNISYQCYLADKVTPQNEFWENINESIYPIAFPKKYSKELIEFNEIILNEFKLTKSNAEPQNKYLSKTFKKINIIDNYIKNNFTIQENGNADLSRLDYILKNKKGSNIGIVQLYSSLLLYNNIDYELLITSNRYFNRFDPDFFNPDNLREILFYIPEIKKYIIPDKKEYRVGEAPFNVLGNYGIYIDKNKDYYFSTIIEDDKRFSTINREINVEFKKMKDLIKKTNFMSDIPNSYFNRDERYTTLMDGLFQIFMGIFWITRLVYFSKAKNKLFRNLFRGVR